MEYRKHKPKAVSPSDVEEVLAGRYEKLLKWGTLLASGDTNTAREIVHDLCLYLMLTRPDFGGIANLDGYLYTSLRHIYLSRMERVARETLRFISISDFDSFGFAMAGTDRCKSVDQQNELRNICSYAIWRKDSLKGFSYFILHFFHGYFPREIAEIASLPVAAIYNKLKVSRTELRSHLASSGNLRSIKPLDPPAPPVALIAVSSSDLFLELRESILRARRSECLPEEELLAHYSKPLNSPIPCALLSHIVSCERCLGLVDRYLGRPTRKDRDPLDGFDRALNLQNYSHEKSEHLGVEAMLRAMSKERDRIYHHRPGALSIAINGRIIASHDIQGIQSRLAARIERPESVQFVEVFSQQQIRLALLAVSEIPPDGPHTLTLHTTLSDDRWLRLDLAFDGLGLQSAVTYFDIALAPHALPLSEEAAEVADQPFVPVGPSTLHDERDLGTAGLIRRIFNFFRPSPALAWTFATACVVCIGSYVASRHTRPTLNAETILSRSLSIETARLDGNTAHEILSLQETSSNGRVLRGSVDVWKDGDNGRYIRRLYDDQHNLVATEWQERGGRPATSTQPRNAAVSEAGRELATNDLWKQDLSPLAFRSIAGHEIQIENVEIGYKLSTSKPADSSRHLLSAVLVIDRGLVPVSETLRMRSGDGVQEGRLVLTRWERQPSYTVPDHMFSPENKNAVHSGVPDRSTGTDRGLAGAASQLVALEIGALYQLDQMGADIGEPIEVARTSDGRVRIYGSMSGEGRRAQVISRLRILPDHQLLSIELPSPDSVQTPATGRPTLILPSTNIYNVTHSGAPADTILAGYFAAKGLPEDRARTAAMQFSHDALGHAQRAQQHAYALDRLGTGFSATDLLSVSEKSKQQWAEMAAGHALSLEHELHALQDQLHVITPNAAVEPVAIQEGSAIDNLPSLAHAADRLLHKTQELDRLMGTTFASGTLKNPEEAPDLLLSKAASAIPLQDVVQMVDFATRFSALAGTKDGQSSSTSQHLHAPKR